MTGNFFKLSYRHFKNDRLYSSLNLLGVLCGIVGATVLIIFILKEYGFDRFQKNHNRIYRITTIFNQQGHENRFALNDGLWDDVLANEVTGVEASTAFVRAYGGCEFSVGDKSLFADNGLYADSDFLKVFDFPLLYGTRTFTEPNSIILSSSLAKKIFGRTDVVGETVDWNIQPDYSMLLKVTAVLQDIPENSSIQFDFVMPGTLMGPWWINQFSKTDRRGNTLYIYFKTFEHESVGELQEKIDKAFSKDKRFKFETPVEPLTDVHFDSENQFELEPGGNREYVNLFIGLTLAFVLITILNAINLNSVRSLRRVKEVGVRRLFGGRKSDIRRYFTLESVFTSILCAIGAFLLLGLVFTNINLGQFSLRPSNLLHPGLIGILIAYSILLGLIISIPFSRISGTPLVTGLKGKTSIKPQRLFGAKNIAIVIQLIAAVCTIAFSFIVFRQINYLRTLDLGYEKGNILILIKPPSASQDIWNSFEDRLRDYPEIEQTGGSSMRLLGLGGMNNAQFSPKEVLGQLPLGIR